ncbi:MAG: hypothetical protein B6244_02610 [Candidatus Cloacimonetes bacterium 4572_55]|nr:MAG: hypothetical protein B6244_02610 [Candidatus Cloacimonetes bacterium 4572_55]
MNLIKTLPVYLFDTSGLIDFALRRTANHEDLVTILEEEGQYLYHPITLAELAQYYHKKIWNPSLPDKKVKEGISMRRLLVSTLYNHCKKRDPEKSLLSGRLFLPCPITFLMFSRVAHQRSCPEYLCKSGDRCTVVCNMVDHLILGAAEYLASKKFSVTFVSGDKMQLAAAARLRVGWIYSKDPGRKNPFQWKKCP